MIEFTDIAKLCTVYILAKFPTVTVLCHGLYYVWSQAKLVIYSHRIDNLVHGVASTNTTAGAAFGINSYPWLIQWNLAVSAIT